MLRRLVFYQTDSDIYFSGDPDFDIEFVSKYLIFPSLDENDFSCTVMYSLAQKECSKFSIGKSLFFRSTFLCMQVPMISNFTYIK